MNRQEEVLKIEALRPRKKARDIVVKHLTVRQSIALLITRLVVLEIISAILLILSIWILLTKAINAVSSGLLIQVGLPLVVIVVFARICLMIFMIAQWLENYYEITPNMLIEKRGFLFKKEYRHLLNHLGLVRIEQGPLGRIFHFGTIRLHNWVLGKDEVMYLIHNPMKYERILKSLIPGADEQKEIFREHMMEPED